MLKNTVKCKKVIFLVNDITPVGGIERSTIDLANSLIAQNREVEILSIFNKFKKVHFDCSKKIIIKYGWNINVNNKIVRWILIILSILKLTNKKNYIIISTSPNISISCAILRIKNVYAIEHGSFYGQSKLSVILRKIFYKNLKEIICLTTTNSKIINQECNVISLVIPNQYNYYHNNYYHNNNDTFTIVSVGRLSIEKGMDNFIRYADSLLKRGMNFNFEIYGEGQLKEDLQNLILNLDIADKVKIKANVKDINEIFSGKIFYVNMSNYESFGMTLLEAMGNRVPVVAYSDLDGPKDIIQDGFNGILVDRNNLNEACDRLIKLFNDKVEKDKIINNAFIGLRKYEESAIMDHWNKIL